jgi:sugar lactone lactonase YvrE
MPEVQRLLTGLTYGESPRWHGDRLWFCNWGSQEVIAVDLDGKREVIVRWVTGYEQARY